MKINDPNPDRLPRAASMRRSHGVARLHRHSRTIEMSINSDVIKRLGWINGDQVVYTVVDDHLRVKKLEL